MAKKRRHQRSYQGGGRLSGLYVLFTVVVVLAASGAGCIVFFKGSSVEIYIRDSSGSTEALAQDDRYTQEEILEAADIDIGDNLFLLNKNRAAAGILAQLTYVSSVSIQKELPGVVVLTLTESSAAVAIQDGDDWWLIDLNGKLLEQTDSDQGCTVILGLTPVDPAKGEALSVPDGSDGETDSQTLRLDSLLQLLTPLQDYALLEDVVSIDLSSESTVVLDYDGRIQVKLPIEADYSEKIKYFAQILTEYVAESWTEDDTGTLDMTYSDGNPHLVKDEN
ncbi:MAG: FtsQ-type POTRA domain-containing protein [Clostridiales bacterium]|nr:FtsQ-type POTRA domain-containing protein [Clostridiales bacterium]